MNRDTWTIILAYVGVKEMAKMAIINKLFNEIIKSQQYLNNLSETDQHVLFYKACEDGKYDYVCKLLKNVDPSLLDNYCIGKASENGHHKMVELLLKDNRISPSAWNQYAIRQASKNGHIGVVKLLLNDPRVDPSIGYHAPLTDASKNGHLEIVILLLNDPRVKILTDKYFAIRQALENGHMKIVKVLEEALEKVLSNKNYKKHLECVLRKELGIC